MEKFGVRPSGYAGGGSLRFWAPGGGGAYGSGQGFRDRPSRIPQAAPGRHLAAPQSPAIAPSKRIVLARQAAP